LAHDFEVMVSSLCHEEALPRTDQDRLAAKLTCPSAINDGRHLKKIQKKGTDGRTLKDEHDSYEVNCRVRQTGS